jgi:hypothetical protein
VPLVFFFKLEHEMVSTQGNMILRDGILGHPFCSVLFTVPSNGGFKRRPYSFLF